MSLSSAQFLDAYRLACVKPLIKKPSLDYEDMNNYRPISNLRFDSKLVERVAMSQLQTYLKENVGLWENNQSAYRSTETALLRVCNGLLQTWDNPGWCGNTCSSRLFCRIPHDRSPTVDCSPGGEIWYNWQSAKLVFILSWESHPIWIASS